MKHLEALAYPSTTTPDSEVSIFLEEERELDHLSTRGTSRVNMRHGVSRLRSGRRHTVGIIFHDAL